MKEDLGQHGGSKHSSNNEAGNVHFLFDGYLLNELMGWVGADRAMGLGVSLLKMFVFCSLGSWQINW